MSEAHKQPDNALGSLVTECKALKLTRDALMRQFDEADNAFKLAKERIVEELRTQGTMMTKVDGVGTASISTEIVSNTTDWVKFGKYVVDNNMPELFQKRVNQGAYKELRDRGEDIPGLEDYENVTLNFRVIDA